MLVGDILALCDQSDGLSGLRRLDVSGVRRTEALVVRGGKKVNLSKRSQTQTQELHRHLTSSLCRSKLSAGPSGKRRRGKKCRGRGRAAGECRGTGGEHTDTDK